MRKGRSGEDGICVSYSNFLRLMRRLSLSVRRSDCCASVCRARMARMQLSALSA